MARPDPRLLAAIFAGGVVGALARAGLARALPHDADAWPWATFAVNLVGAFLLGWFVTRLQERLALTTYLRPFLGTGVCGALTTFSTMEVELLRMIDAQAWGLAVGYAAASLADGLGAVVLASNLARGARLVAR
jgi:fluoride exporter